MTNNRPGHLSDWLDVYKEVDGQSSNSGEILETPGKIATIPALLQEGTGSEQMVSDQPVGMMTHKVTHRYFSGLTTKHYYVMGTRTLRITSLRNPDGVQIWHEATVTERI